MNDIFISYSRKDKKIVKEFYQRFIDAGFTVWMDEDEIEFGDDFKDRIVNAIWDSEILVFFSSRDSILSENTKSEISIAKDDKKKIFPIKLDGAKYSGAILYDIGRLNWIDCSVSYKRDYMLTHVIMPKLERMVRHAREARKAAGENSGNVVEKIVVERAEDRSFIVGRFGRQRDEIQDRTVSREHCRVTLLDDGMVEVENLSKSNGTATGGVKIDKAVVSPDSFLKMGNYTVLVRDLFPPRETPSKPDSQRTRQTS